MPNTMPSEYAAWDPHISCISWPSSASRLSLTCSPIHSHRLLTLRTESTVEMQLHTLQPSTILPHRRLEMEIATGARYRQLRCLLTALQRNCQSPPSWRRLQRWEWSELALEMASRLEWDIVRDMASLRTEIVVGMVFGLELQKASGMPSESILIGRNCFEVIQNIWLAPQLCFLGF